MKSSLRKKSRGISECRKVEEDLCRLVSIVESSNDAILSKTLEGVIVSWNHAAEEIYGYSEEEAKGKNISMIMPADRLDELRGILKKVKQGERIEHFETTRIKKDGRKIYVSLTISPILDSAGRVTGASTIARDITKLKEMERIKDEFVSTISHELRTPLSITKEGISLVLDGIPGKVNDKQAEILVTSKNNIDRLARVIDSLLDISKIEAGRVELKRRIIDVYRIANSVVSSFMPKVKNKGLQLQLSISEKEVEVYGDADKITQVFTNLIGNALKFTEKGRIEVSIRQLRDGVECSVSDTGIGISAENLPKLFDKFEQFGRGVGAGEKGTGLGLAITKGIIEMHQGRIWVESKPGKGARFSFSLPKYAFETMFRAHIKDGIREAEKNNSKLSLVIVSLANFGKIQKEFSAEKMALILRGIQNTLKAGLRRQADVVAGGMGEVVVLLSGCGREDALITQGRLAQALDDYLAREKFSDKIKFRFASATYPDEAKNDEDLVKKARNA